MEIGSSIQICKLSTTRMQMLAARKGVTTVTISDAHDACPDPISPHKIHDRKKGGEKLKYQEPSHI